MTATESAARQTDVTTSIDLTLCYRLLGMDEDEPLHDLYKAARADTSSLPHLIISLLQDMGVPLGSGAADVLRRANDRAATYDRIEALVGATTDARVVKGPSLARRYPAGLRRPVGDLDFITADQPGLWAAVGAITRAYDVEQVAVSVFGGPLQHVLVNLAWLPDDPVLDADLSVDLCTAAFAGDFQTVGVRAELPADGFVADLLSLAEEKFQRPFSAKDVIDVIVLSGSATPSVAEIAESADHLRLAPELYELLDRARPYIERTELAEVIPLLAAPARQERRRRETQPRFDGRPEYGMLLRRVPFRDDMSRGVVHDFADGSLLRTPVGDYLLVADEIVAQDLFRSALAELDRL